MGSFKILYFTWIILLSTQLEVKNKHKKQRMPSISQIVCGQRFTLLEIVDNQHQYTRMKWYWKLST